LGLVAVPLVVETEGVREGVTEVKVGFGFEVTGFEFAIFGLCGRFDVDIAAVVGSTVGLCSDAFCTV
jgi:hypothetical protein